MVWIQSAGAEVGGERGWQLAGAASGRFTADGWLAVGGWTAGAAEGSAGAAAAALGTECSGESVECVGIPRKLPGR